MFQGGKNCKNRYKGYHQRHSRTCGTAHRQKVCLFKMEAGQKDTDRNGMGGLPNEEEHSKLEARQKYTPGDECGQVY